MFVFDGAGHSHPALTKNETSRLWVEANTLTEPYWSGAEASRKSHWIAVANDSRCKAKIPTMVIAILIFIICSVFGSVKNLRTIAILALGVFSMSEIARVVSQSLFVAGAVVIFTLFAVSSGGELEGLFNAPRHHSVLRPCFTEIISHSSAPLRRDASNCRIASAQISQIRTRRMSAQP